MNAKWKFPGLLLIIGAVYLGARMLAPAETPEPNIADQLAPGNQVIMYSLTTCGYCLRKRRSLTAAGIPFTEYFIDADAVRMKEFDNLLAAKNIPSGNVGVPSFTVNGVLLINNPDMAQIRQHLKFKS